MQTFDRIPVNQPETPLLDKADSPAELRKLPEQQLPELADQLREYLLYSVGQSGGHFGAGLGVVELTIALHYLYNTPEDRIVWDVGHQTYPHKILTERRAHMHSIRQQGGLSGFPKRNESDYDSFGVGHSSTSISAALGMALAAQHHNLDRKVAAIIGDGALTGGMAIEALSHAAHTQANLLVILNDNQMSISRNTGGLNNYFSKIWASKPYTELRAGSKKILSKIPSATGVIRRAEEYMKGMVSPATLFEEFGFNYIGPIDGHDLPTLLHIIGNMRDLPGPQLLHIMTAKGKGFSPAEADPIGYHAINKIETPNTTPKVVGQKAPKYQDVFGAWLCYQAEQDANLVGITPAMCEGSGMVEFAEKFQDRYFDVAIAEQHAVTLAAGMACDGLKPVVAIYSTFLQRAYDQLIHDVAIQALDVMFAIDRAGLVGEDGPTHAGSFDISFLRCIPNMVIMCPSDENETWKMLNTGYHFQGPAAIRYPRGAGTGVHIDKNNERIEIGKGQMLREGKDIAILNFGTLLPAALQTAEKLNLSVADMRFVKPIDEKLIDELVAKHSLIVTLEENSIAGGVGSAVSEYLNNNNRTVSLLQLGLPDQFIEHGAHEKLLADIGLDVKGIESQIVKHLNSEPSLAEIKAIRTASE